MPRVLIHYCVEGDTTVYASVRANVATIDFIMRGLPGQPENYRPVTIETVNGDPLTDFSQPPPDTVYVIGVRQ